MRFLHLSKSPFLGVFLIEKKLNISELSILNSWDRVPLRNENTVQCNYIVLDSTALVSMLPPLGHSFHSFELPFYVLQKLNELFNASSKDVKYINKFLKNKFHGPEMESPAFIDYLIPKHLLRESIFHLNNFREILASHETTPTEYLTNDKIVSEIASQDLTLLPREKFRNEEYRHSIRIAIFQSAFDWADKRKGNVETLVSLIQRLKWPDLHRFLKEFMISRHEKLGEQIENFQNCIDELEREYKLLSNPLSSWES